MTTSNTKQRFIIRKDWVINAAPIAGVCILLSLGFHTIALALLQLWLWLRHPRDSSRYAIAAIPVGILGLLQCVEIYLDYRESLITASTMSVSDVKRDTFALIGAISAGGSVAILYRLFSRNSLIYVGESRPSANAGASRGSIADILFLTVFFALTFVALREIKIHSLDLFGYRGQATDPVAMAIAASISGILSMRLISSTSGLVLVGRLTLATILSFILMFAVLQLSVWLHWWSKHTELHPWSKHTEGEFAFAWESSFSWYWQGDLGKLLIATASIQSFALLMRCCGVVLGRNAELSHSLPTRTPARTRPLTLISGWAIRILGMLSLALAVGAICFWPGQSGAGIPWTFLRSDGSGDLSFQNVSLSWPMLIADMAVCILVTMALMVAIQRNARPAIRRTARITLVGFAILVFYACYRLPVRNAMVSLETDSMSLSFTTILESGLQNALYELERRWNLDSAIDRTDVDAAQLNQSNADEILWALSQPHLGRLYLQDCAVTPSAFQALSASSTLDRIVIENCQLPQNAGSILSNLASLNRVTVDLPALKSLNIESFNQPQRVDLEIYTDGTETIRIPAGVGAAVIHVPPNFNGKIQLENEFNADYVSLTAQ